MVEHIEPIFHEPAFKLSSKIIKHLINNWSPHNNGVLYSVNLPMIEKLVHEELKIYWTYVWRSDYGRLFIKVPDPASGEPGDTIQTTDATVLREGIGNSEVVVEEEKLVFAFKPDLSELLSESAAPEGSDSWALNVGAASVTPYLTSFAELPESEHSFPRLQDREWKL